MQFFRLLIILCQVRYRCGLDKYPCCWRYCLTASFFLVLVLQAYKVEAGLEQTCNMRDYGSPMGRCGSQLFQVIDMLCDGKYYHSAPKTKRSNPDKAVRRSVEDLTKEERDLAKKRSIGRLLRSRSITKKPYTNEFGNKEVMDAKLNDDKVFMTKESALSFLTSRRSKRTKRQYSDALIPSSRTGIVCECCVHNCDIYELQQYCAE